jgi:hypothetical protein
VAPPPSSLGFDLPSQVDAAIVRALEPDREKRWPDVQTYTNQLVGALDENTRDLPLSERETVHIAGAPGDTDDPNDLTALSDANQPTIVKPADPSETTEAVPAATESAVQKPEPAAGEPAAAEAAARAVSDAVSEAAAQARTEAASTTGVPRKKRRGRWVVAALLALVVGGGAGYGAQWYLAGREEVTVAKGGFKVKLPRAWAQSMATSVWTVPGSNDSAPAFRVSKDPDWSGHSPGVFIGVSKTKLAVPESNQCENVGTPGSRTAGEQTVTDRISSGCFGADIVLLQRVVDHGDGGSLLVQVTVPSDSLVRATEIANTVQYPSS